MDQYHFLVGEFAKNSPFIPAAASAQLFAWFAHIGERVERYGNKRGKIVKFSQQNDEKMLFAPETDSIALLSPRIVPPDEADEATNCDAQAMYSSDSPTSLRWRRCSRLRGPYPACLTTIANICTAMLKRRAMAPATHSANGSSMRPIR
ncbi:hypothetical protein CNX70_07815 [Janthinobacterium svalbardensis]|uniref:Uncharacterized protein n=2 Tax=Janthinobacterium svalbardensis TaxID=368607 RepID=A0A290WT87_9BURK|nr:hypothetical protein CNX70_07815 [Janthinobacterium svalbardensis]